MSSARDVIDFGFDPAALSGWAGQAQRDATEARVLSQTAIFQELPADWSAVTQLKRVTAWDSLEKIPDAMRWVFTRHQEIGDCVSWGAMKAAAATMAHEIVRGKERERWHPVFEPYLYGTGRCAPEGGNGRLRNSDGSLGSWQAAVIVIYGVLRADFPGVPAYSGAVAKRWGACQGWQQFEQEGRQHPFGRAAPVRTAQQLAEAISNGYFATIAGNRQFPSRLTIRDGKGWYEGGNRYPHQTSYLAYDHAARAFYDSNQWPQHAVGQPDGPDGGGWRSWEYVDKELRSNSVECYVFSQFEGFPAERQKPDFSMI